MSHRRAKVPLDRLRVRNVDGGDIPLGSYLSFQHDPQWHSRLWQDVMRGLSTRQYGPVVRRFADAYGIEKSVVSEQFIEASRQKLRELIERPLGDLKLCAVMIDGITFDGETFIVALGIGQDGRKTVLGLRQGATENATVVGELCAELEQRGVDFQQPRLYVLDGAKALNVAVKKRAGEAALLQRCQLHKRRNVLNHLPEEQQPFMEQKLIAAWNMVEHPEARHALDRIHDDLETDQPQRGTKPGRRAGRNPDHSPLARAGEVASDLVLHQSHRIATVGGRGEMRASQEVAGRRYEIAVGRQRTSFRGRAVSESEGLPRDSAVDGSDKVRGSTRPNEAGCCR